MRRIGNYVVKGLLGRGGMGAVYKALHPVLDKMTALKVLSPEETLEASLGMDRLKEQFLREARIMASLNHPNIADVFDGSDGSDGGPVYFAMEYCCGNLGLVMGESYRADAPSRVLPLDRACAYAGQILRGLGRMHHAGIVHRDIKPFNILLADRDRVKIIDFGLSRLRGETRGAGSSNIKIGTPFYAAPEQERDPDTVGPQADLYAAGVTLFRMLCGRLPLVEDEDDPVLSRTGRGPDGILKISGLNSDLDSGWDEFFFKSLAQRPEGRFASAGEMAGSLKVLVREWRARMEGVCRMIEELESPGGEIQSTAPRSRPVKVGPARAGEALGLDGLGFPREYRESLWLAPEGGTVRDMASGLEWEIAGSRYPLTMDQAEERILEMNQRDFAGHADWRVPTVDELTTLLSGRPSAEDFCIPAAFDPEKPLLWSSDRKSFTANWHLNATMGFVGYQDRTCRFWVRAVRSFETDS